MDELKRLRIPEVDTALRKRIHWKDRRRRGLGKAYTLHPQMLSADDTRLHFPR